MLSHTENRGNKHLKLYCNKNPFIANFFDDDVCVAQVTAEKPTILSVFDNLYNQSAYDLENIFWEILRTFYC